MGLGEGQKRLIRAQKAAEENKPFKKLPVNVGSIVEFVTTPKFNGTVKLISKDQWQTIYIDYGGEHLKLINGYEFIDLLKQGKIIIKNQ